jgi:hypothetical protein
VSIGRPKAFGVSRQSVAVRPGKRTARGNACPPVSLLPLGGFRQSAWTAMTVASGARSPATCPVVSICSRSATRARASTRSAL